ncbi:MAG: hypothetical protein CR986_01835 [Ignavibacteriae bacterium]|nr:MAG: hypothetical protein CR986_01835 [Ignavibacteriota bacterium]
MKNIIVKSISLLIILSSFTIAQDLEETLFKTINNKIKEAVSTNVNLMSPTFFEKAAKLVKNAKKDLKDGANLSDIKEQITEADDYLNRAFKTSEVGKVTFTKAIEARKDALAVDAQKNVNKTWIKAEEKLHEAGEDLEDGDVNDAREEAKSAENLFRTAELEAIKISYLVETRNKISDAEDLDIQDTAPKTLALSKKLVNECEKELNNNRYDTDLPRSLAKSAQYEIAHAYYIDKVVNDFNKNDNTLENMILDIENDFSKIISALEIEKDFTSGFSPMAELSAGEVTKIKNENSKLKESVAALEHELNLLKKELSGLSAEKSELAVEMDKLNKLKAKYAKIDKMFTNGEAQVLRKENDIIIRLVGLSFDVGKAIIQPENFGLLTKLKKAIKEFPESTISIEGHTDSFGSDAKNLELSQKRADAVTQYLLANMDISSSKIKSTGYGETKPIANNETKEGRAKNRRIDLILHNN